jgi:hypothetical protein
MEVMDKVLEDEIEINIRVGPDNFKTNNTKLAKAIRKAAELTAKKKFIESQLQKEKGKIISFANQHRGKRGSVNLDLNDVKCKTIFPSECVVPAAGAKRLKGILGSRYDEVIKTNTELKGTRYLITLAKDNKAIRDRIVIKPLARRVEFILLKPMKENK